jgi:hypothetical protein
VSFTSRFKSTWETRDKEEAHQSNHHYAFDENGETAAIPTETVPFPASNPRDPEEMEYQPILLNAKEHAVGYLSRILNARVYEAAIETELQHAKNLSSVSRTDKKEETFEVEGHRILIILQPL